MQSEEITEKDRAKAKQCLECPLCKRAREKQKGLVFWFVKKLESGLCPACKAYEKVYQRKSHEPIPKSGGTNNSGQ
ncbi:MAG: hypothetical protein A2Z38_00045 [Planctomycetes bacterium RBG_19FT_COMBO_48_8]|nr:MAG: hypothetical protein A2Z38_00045 [Planctomycetes bacterium RBG_19FT_COMBO_48_8]